MPPYPVRESATASGGLSSRGEPHEFDARDWAAVPTALRTTVFTNPTSGAADLRQ